METSFTHAQKRAITKAYKGVSSNEKRRIHGGSPLAKLINMKKSQTSLNSTKRDRFFKSADYKGGEKEVDIKKKVLNKANINK